MENLERLTQALADRYGIEREIGRGGMATVYLAQDQKHQLRHNPVQLAARLLERSYGEGILIWDRPHRDYPLKPLRVHPPFEELVRPKG